MGEFHRITSKVESKPSHLFSDRFSKAEGSGSLMESLCTETTIQIGEIDIVTGHPHPTSMKGVLVFLPHHSPGL